MREIIGLQAAVAELGELYGIAKGFKALQVAAESELLPRTEAIASRLRSLVRHDQLDQVAVDDAAAEISDLLGRWEDALEELHASPTYRTVLDAWQAGDHRALVDLLPRVFAGLRPVATPPRLFRGFSVSSGRRRPGTSPFLTARAAADKIAALRREGIRVEDGGDWWDAELAHLMLFDDPAATDNPVALCFRAEQLGVPVFCVDGDPAYRIYSRELHAPFSVVLEREAEDEWWQASEEPYAAFRDALAAELRTRGIDVEGIGP